MTMSCGDPDWDDHHDKPLSYWQRADERQRVRHEANTFVWWVAMIALVVALGIRAALRWVS